MSRLLQPLQRRAVAALAWLVLALAVVPVAAESVRPLAAYAVAASSVLMAMGRSPPGTTDRGVAASLDAAPGRTGTRALPAVALSVRRASSSLGRARLASLAALLHAQHAPHAQRCDTRDERRLYLSLCRLSC